MTDVKTDDPLNGFCERELRETMELLYYGYRDFTSEPDAILAKYGFGRAHHRVIYFVGRYPGTTVSQLLSILRITKQSLSRVLRQLVRENFIAQAPGARDRRQRLLQLTEKGAELERNLAAAQWARIAQAFRAARPDAVAGFRAVVLALINDRDRRKFLANPPGPRG